jgi:hypothetical protein
VDLRKTEPQMDSALSFWNEVEWQNRERIKQEVDLMKEEL